MERTSAWWETYSREGPWRHGGAYLSSVNLHILWSKTLTSLEPEMQPLARRRMKFLKIALKSMLPSASIADEEQSPF